MGGDLRVATLDKDKDPVCVVVSLKAMGMESGVMGAMRGCLTVEEVGL